jgi:hypothetical protein
LWGLLGVLILLFFIPEKGFAQEEDEFYEISVFLEVNRIGGAEIPSIINDRIVYLSVSDLFDFLRIKNSVTGDFDAVTGFLMNENNIYNIDRTTNTIQYVDKIYTLKEKDMLRTETGLYLKSDYFGEVFGLECTFDFRTLKVTLNTQLELPIIREMRLESMHRGIRKLTGEMQADITLKREYPLLSFGMMDLTANSAQMVNGPTNTRVNLGFGGIILGGEANVVLNYNSRQPFTEREQYYLWRFANNDFKVMKQAMAGRISTFATSSIYNPVVGVQFTNSPTSYRRSFGTYTLSDYTKPGWTVELYVNNTLIDYQQADASGFYSFEVPLIYGSTEIKLRFYGPWGEERTKEQSINVPFSFVPKNTLEYRVSAAYVEDGLHSVFSRGEVNYGLGRYLTVGGGVEYLSSVTSGPVMPFLNATVSLGGKLLFTGNYTYGVQLKGLLNYRFNSGLQFDLEYTKYDKDQTAISYNYLDVRKFTVSMPVHISAFSMLARFRVSNYVMPLTQYTNAELILSGSMLGVATNISTFANFSPGRDAYVYTNASLRFRMFKDLFISPIVQYSYNDGQLISARCEIEKRITKHGYLSASYEEVFRGAIRNVQVGLRFDLDYVNTSAYVRTGNRGTVFFENASTSMQFGENGYVNVSNRSSVGRGGLIVMPFLDINGNGKYDKNEPRVSGVEVKASSGMVKKREKDTCIIVSELEPYADCYIELNTNNLDNIAWSIKNKTYKVAVNANQYRTIEVPISVVAEVSGMVYKKSGNKTEGLGRVIVNIYDISGNLVGNTLSESDGFYSYMGLTPGSYIVKIDPKQMKKLNMTVSPDGTPITIRQLEDGDFVDDIDFVITSNK